MPPSESLLPVNRRKWREVVIWGIIGLFVLGIGLIYWYFVLSRSLYDPFLRFLLSFLFYLVYFIYPITLYSLEFFLRKNRRKGFILSFWIYLLITLSIVGYIFSS